MANEFKVKKGLIVDGSNTVLDIQGTQGQLFSVTDSLTGDLFSVSDVSGIPILNVNSSSAVDIDGTLNLGDNNKIQLGASQDLQIFHDGTNSYIDNGTGNLYIRNLSDDKDIIFQSDDGSGGLATYFFLDTASNATQFTKTVYLQDNVKANFGNSSDLKIYHDGSNSYIDDASGTGSLYVNTNAFRLVSANKGENMIRAFEDGQVILSHNNVDKLATTGAGVTVTGTMTASADVVAYSDERLKTNIKTLDGSKVYKMRGVSFVKDDKEGSGVIAQELEKIAPELVSNDNEYKAVAYGNITGYLIEAIKELKVEIEELKKQVK